MKIVYFGTPAFAAEILEYLLAQGVEVCAVITKPDKPKGRSGTPLPTPVKEVALRHQLPVYQPELVSALEFAPKLSAYKADLFVVVAYGEIIKQHLLDMPAKGCINLHASLLPKYRGAAPIQHSILAGETETGVTIIHMVKKMDAGDMVSIAKVPIGLEMTYGELETALCQAGAPLLFQAIRDLDAGTASRTPQDPALATLAPKIELENCEIHWSEPAPKLHNLIRGVNPHPGAWCKVSVREQPLRLKINSAEIKEGKGTPGELIEYGKAGIVIACGEGALKLHLIQLEGKKAMTAEELARGIPREQFHFYG